MVLPIRGGIRDDFQSKICQVWKVYIFFLWGGGPRHDTEPQVELGVWKPSGIVWFPFPKKSLSFKERLPWLGFRQKIHQQKNLGLLPQYQPATGPAPRTRHLRLLASTWQAQLLEIWHWHCWNKTGRFDGWNEKKKGRCTFGTCTVWDGNSYLHKMVWIYGKCKKILHIWGI